MQPLGTFPLRGPLTLTALSGELPIWQVSRLPYSDERVVLDDVLAQGLAPHRDGWLMENDAMDGDEPVLFAYTCDMPRIKRFDNALHIHDMRGTLYCFDFQEAALRQICGPGIKIQDLDFEKVKALLFDGDC